MNSSMSSATVSAINALLPQTQCRQCGYQGCLPYAEAIATGEAPINRCPPGGTEGILRLAALTRQVVLPLDESCGVTKPLLIAKVDEANCIGCTLCIQACPVDAIVGAAKHMHTILADRCTGCELCLPPCPTECIEMLPSEGGGVDFPAPLGFERAVIARDAHAARLLRLQRDKDERAKRLAEKTQTSATNNTTTTAVVAEAAPTSQPADPRMAAIMAAMARAKRQLDQK